MAWQELPSEEYNSVWDRFYAQFEFRPTFHERTVPAIREPAPFMTFDLSQDMSDLQIDVLDVLFGDAFSAISGSEQRMLALDWQHTSYRFDPHASAEWLLSIYPDGDCYIFLADDFSFGTFGHPWQQSLCVFGQPLLDVIADRLRDMLPVLRSG